MTETPNSYIAPAGAFASLYPNRHYNDSQRHNSWLFNSTFAYSPSVRIIVAEALKEVLDAGLTPGWMNEHYAGVAHAATRIFNSLQDAIEFTIKTSLK